MSNARQIASFVHDPEAVNSMRAHLKTEAARIPAANRDVDYVANRIALAGELSTSRENMAEILKDSGLKATMMHNQRAELVGVTVATPASPLVAVTAEGSQFSDRWANLAGGRTISLDKGTSEKRSSELVRDITDRATRVTAAVEAQASVTPLTPPVAVAAPPFTADPARTHSAS